jgi:hypothetical protein
MLQIYVVLRKKQLFLCEMIRIYMCVRVFTGCFVVLSCQTTCLVTYFTFYCSKQKKAV